MGVTKVCCLGLSQAPEASGRAPETLASRGPPEPRGLTKLEIHGFGDIHDPKSYGFRRFGDIHGHKPYDFFEFDFFGASKCSGMLRTLA